MQKTIRLGVVAPFEPNTYYVKNQKVAIEGKIFAVNIPGTSGSLPDVSSVSNTGTSGTFVNSGSITFKYLGKPFNKPNDLPKEWQWYLVDIQPNLYLINFPDSNDSYAALLVACAAKVATKEWLNTNSGIGGYTYFEVLKKVLEASVINNMDDGLTKVFQQDITPDGTLYPIRFLQDTCEAYTGIQGGIHLANLVQDTSAKNNWVAAANTMKSAVLKLWDGGNNRFATYRGETDWDANNKTYDRFVTKDRFGLAPWRFGLLTENEVSVYGYPALQKILQDFPKLLKDADGIDSFALTSWFAWVAVATNSFKFAKVALRRVAVRPSNLLTIDDIFGAILASPWCGVYQIPQYHITNKAFSTFTPNENYIVELQGNKDEEHVYLDNNALNSVYLRLPTPHDMQKIIITGKNPISNLTIWVRNGYKGQSINLDSKLNKNANSSTTFNSAIELIYYEGINTWICLKGV